MNLTDTHCHLDDVRFDEDRDQVVERAIQVGVDRILNPGIELASSKAAVQNAEKYSQVYAAVGIHPNSSTTWNQDSFETLVELAQHPKVVAIGEIGLDYYRDFAPRYVQEQVFHHQLELAAKLELPVVLHSRDSVHDVVRKVVEWQAQLEKKDSPLAKRPGVIHSYSGTVEQAKEAIASNFMIGFTGPVTFPKADDLRTVAEKIDLDYILIETDAPYLAPQKYRGRRNEPGYVTEMLEMIANIHDMSSEALAEKTSENAARLFLW